MMFNFKLGLGYTHDLWPNDKPRTGIYIQVQNTRMELRKRKSHEVPKDYWPVTNHGWQSGRGGIESDLFYGLPFGLALSGWRENKTYAQAVGFKQSLDWVIDEFDASFNDLAVASLKYHMDYSHCACDDDMRARYTDMISRLTEPSPDTTEEEQAAIDTWDVCSRDNPTYGKDGSVISYRVPDCTPEASSAFDSWGERTDAHKERIRQARKDFIDILPELWS